MNKHFFNDPDFLYNLRRKGAQKLCKTMLLGGKIKSVNLDDIVYLKSDKNYTVFQMKDGSTIISSKTLKVYEEELKGNSSFVRPHRSFMVNFDYVNVLHFNCRGGELLIFDLKINISRRKAAEFRRTYRKFLILNGQNANSTIRQKTKIKLNDKNSSQ
jgi:DNA-binding LytR/AlgR family response regulator